MIKVKVKLEGLEGELTRFQRKVMLFFMREEKGTGKGETVVLYWKKEEKNVGEKGTRKTQNIWRHRENTRSMIPSSLGKAVWISAMQICFHHSRTSFNTVYCDHGNLAIMEFWVKSNGPCFLTGWKRTAQWYRQRSGSPGGKRFNKLGQFSKTLREHFGFYKVEKGQNFEADT